MTDLDFKIITGIILIQNVITCDLYFDLVLFDNNF